MNIIRNDIPHNINPDTWVAVDSEWWGMKKEILHRPTTGDFACLQICPDDENVFFITDKQLAIQALDNIRHSGWIIQEAKFDLTQLGRFVPRDLILHRKTIDTLMMEKELFSGYYNRFGLNHLARRHLGVYLEKELQKSFDSPDLSDEQIEYACKDALYLRKIWDVQKTYITRDDLYVYKQIDLPCMFAVMDFQGFGIDAQGWDKLAKENRAKQEEINANLPIKPSQFAKLKDYLRTHGFPGLESTDEAHLTKALAKYPDTEAGKITQQILDSRMYATRASTYGESWINNYLTPEVDGSESPFYSINANYDIYGTETGRFSCSSPNMQNIPIRETKDFRKLFIPRRGHVLIVGDYSQQEIGVLAYISQDKKLIKMFNTGEDVYILAAKELLNKTITKADPLRKRMKSVVLGIDYGLSKYGLARKENMELDDAEELINNFLHKFPGINEYQLKQRKITSYVKSILGRRIWLNPYSNQCENNALNAPIQSSAADMLKLAIVDMHTHWSFPFPFGLVATIHDELVMDVPIGWEAQVEAFMKESMESMANWMCPGLKFVADVKTCKHNWSEKELEAV